jgi:hypothetical protein
MKCQATSKRSQEPCKKDAMIGRHLCHMHGGKTPCGIAAPSWKDGRYSKYLPTRLIPRYQQARTDRDLGSLTHEIHLLDARIGELVEQLDTGESGGLWAGLVAQADTAEALQQGGDKVQVVAALLALLPLIRAGAAEQAKWAEIVALIDQRRKLIESERKRLVELQQILTLEEASSMIRMIGESIKRHVSDQAALAAISADIGRIMGSTTQRD